MTIATFIIGSKRLLSAGDWPWVIQALRCNPLIWQCLDGALGQKVLEKSPARPQDYSPAALALLSLDRALNLEDLRSSATAVPTEPAYLAAGLAEQDAPEVRLQRAFFYALRWRHDLPAAPWESLSAPADLPAAFACLFGLLSDPGALLHALLPWKGDPALTSSGAQLALHSLLANPLPPQAHQSILHDFLTDLPHPERLPLLEALHAQRPDLAPAAAQAALNLGLSAPQKRPARPRDDRMASHPLFSLGENAVQIWQSARLYDLARQPEEATALREAAAGEIQRLEAALAAEAAQRLADQAGEQALALWQKAVRLDAQRPEYTAGLTLAHISAGNESEAQRALDSLGSAPVNPGLLYAAALLASSRGADEEARDLALRAAQAALPANDAHVPLAPSFARGLAALLLQLDLVSPAVRLVQRHAETSPASVQGYTLLAEAQLADGQAQAAERSAAQAAALAAGDAETMRLLAACLEAGGNWEQAYPLRAELADQGYPALYEDGFALASCALQAGKTEAALDGCARLIQEDGEDANAWVLQGQAFAASGDAVSALESLQHATQIAPDLPAPWLALAGLHRGMGQPARALDTLRAALQISPDLPEVQLALGEAYLEQGAFTQALAALSAAHDLAQHARPRRGRELPGAPPSPRPISSQILLRLGQVHRRLGQHEEARQALETAYQRRPGDVVIAQEYAQALSALDMPELALAPLRAVLATAPADAAAYLEYARVLLSLHQQGKSDTDIAGALPALERALQLEPGNPLAVALHAEALAAAGNYPAALEAYQSALESELARDPAWLGRLSMGLGEAAIHLGQIDAAVAAFQEAQRACPGDSKVLRGLSEALEAAGLTDDAYRKALAARQAAPADPDTLAWFAAQVADLSQSGNNPAPNALAEAIAALEQAVSLAPTRSDLWLQLGQAQLNNAKYPAALLAFKKMAELPPVRGSARDYYLAAQGLLHAGDAPLAVECLQRALQCAPSGGEDEPALLDMLTALALAQRKAGQTAESLRALDQALALAPNEADLYLEKADLLLSAAAEVTPDTAREQTRLALSCLDAALKLKPKDAELRLRAAGIHRSAGDLAMAQAHIAQILNMTRPSATLEMQAHTLAAEIAQAMLQPQQAWKHLESLLPSALAGRPEASVRVSYFARRASLALHRHQEQDAVEALVEVVELAPDSPSLLAIQARLSLRRGDPKAAASLFASCLKAIGDPVSARLADLYEIAEAAIELGNWEVLRGIHAAMLRIAPREPAIYWLAARSLAVQAERQRLYPLLDVIRRAPGEQALNQTASLEFEAALDQAAGLAGLDAPAAAGPGESMAEAQALIERWLARGRAAFQPNALHAQKLAALTADPEDTAARVACLRNCGDSAAASQAAREASHHPLVLLHLALTLQNEKPRQAMAAIHAAADAISVDSAAARKGESASIAPAARWAAPLIHILTARLFHRNGHRASDYSNALQAVLRALDAWPDEPRWRTLAAEIYLDGAQQGETSARQEATTQLEQAASLDAAHVPTLLLLGQIHLEDGRLPHAIEIFEKAAFAAPEDSQIFLWLARAHRVAGDLDQAAQRAERAVALAPNQAEPLLLRGEIALQANNPRGALSRAQAALRITPENPAGLLLLAQALSALERDDEALVGLEKALALLGEPISLSIERVRLLHRLRGLPAALQAAQQLASRYPDEPAVLGQLAALLDASGDEENAIRAAQRALRDAALAALLAPGDQIALHYLLGRGLRRAGQLDQAVLHLKEAIRLDPEAMDAYLELGRAHLERREYRQALQVFNQAAGLAPTDHRPYYEIGLALKESKDYLGAEKMLRRAAELAPNDLAIHRLLAAVVALNLVHNRREPRESKLTKV